MTVRRILLFAGTFVYTADAITAQHTEMGQVLSHNRLCRNLPVIIRITGMRLDRNGGNTLFYLISLISDFGFYTWCQRNKVGTNTHHPIISLIIDAGIKFRYAAILYIFLALSVRSGR